MGEYRYSGNYDDPLLAELYDRSEADTDDVEMIRRLIGHAGPLNILECFSGTGRILIPLAQDGHTVTGIEVVPSMSARAADKLAGLGEEIRDRVTLKVQDALDGRWGAGYNLVILGANAFFELPSAEMQERCIRFAREVLVPGGWLLVDNNDYKGDWVGDPSGDERVVFEGSGGDGTHGRWSVVGVGFDKEHDVLHMKRTWLTRAPDGTETCTEYLCSKHPVTAREVEGWLKKHGFEILQVFGDRHGNPHTEESGRAIFWARRPQPTAR